MAVTVARGRIPSISAYAGVRAASVAGHEECPAPSATRPPTAKLDRLLKPRAPMPPMMAHTTKGDFAMTTQKPDLSAVVPVVQPAPDRLGPDHPAMKFGEAIAWEVEDMLRSFALQVRKGKLEAADVRQILTSALYMVEAGYLSPIRSPADVRSPRRCRRGLPGHARARSSALQPVPCPFPIMSMPVR